MIMISNNDDDDDGADGDVNKVEVGKRKKKTEEKI